MVKVITLNYDVCCSKMINYDGEEENEVKFDGVTETFKGD